jgi:hypothetical protein
MENGCVSLMREKFFRFDTAVFACMCREEYHVHAVYCNIDSVLLNSNSQLCTILEANLIPYLALCMAFAAFTCACMQSVVIVTIIRV